MRQKIITLCYKKIVAAGSTDRQDKQLFHATYAEFKMQAQYYDQQKKHQTFAEMVKVIPSAEKMHFLVSTSAIDYVKGLNEVVPDVVDNLGKPFLRFNQFEFRIIDSAIYDSALHQVAIYFVSQPLIWHDTVGDYLVVSALQDDEDSVLSINQFRLMPNLSIYTLQTVST